MEGFTIQDYNEAMLDEMMQLFYETVHTVNALHYKKEQLNGWAPKNWDRKFWEGRLKKNTCKVAFWDRTIVGFTELVDNGHVDTLYVHKDFQRRKIAANLLEVIEGIAENKKFQALTTEASVTARPFFEAQGFRVTRIKKKLFNGKDFTNFKMRKELLLC